MAINLTKFKLSEEQIRKVKSLLSYYLKNYKVNTLYSDIAYIEETTKLGSPVHNVDTTTLIFHVLPTAMDLGPVLVDLSKSDELLNMMYDIYLTETKHEEIEEEIPQGICYARKHGGGNWY